MDEEQDIEKFTAESRRECLAMAAAYADAAESIHARLMIEKKRWLDLAKFQDK